MQEYMVYIWLGLIILGIIVETASPQLVSIWFVFGFTCALISSLFSVDIWIQVVIAATTSVGSLIATKPLVKKIMSEKKVRTNADRCIGEEAFVTEEIDKIKETGAVKVKGLTWSAVPMESGTIKQGEIVTVERIEGVKLVVKLK